MTIAQGELILASDMPCVARATFNGVDASFNEGNTTVSYVIPYSILTFQSGSINLLTQCNQIFVVNLCSDARIQMINYIDTLSHMYQDGDGYYASFRTLFLDNSSISINFSTANENITINIIKPSQLSSPLSSWQGVLDDDADIPYLLFGYKI